MADTTGVLARLQAALSVYDPTWDVSVGTATYKILEAVAQEIAYANNNSTLQTYSYDINTKFGTELDAFVNLFGLYRQLGQRATGLVTFTTSTPAVNIIDIPVGVQVAVPIGGNYVSPIYFTTTVPAIIGIGDTSVDVPVISSLPGLINNVPPNTITTMSTTLVGVNSVNNSNSMTGAVDPESDAQLRGRWQSTVFNNTTGTDSKYVLTALQDPYVSVANSFGQQNYYTEQLQVQASVATVTGTFVTFSLVAYSGMTNVISGTTYSGTSLVAYSGFAANTTAATLASGLTALISGVAPNNQVVVSATGTSINGGGVTLFFSNPSPYRLIIGNGTGQTTITGVAYNGTTFSGVTYQEFLLSNNQDIGVSGTLSYTNTASGYLFPQGNELVGVNLNAYNQTVYVPNSDYIYPSGSPTPQLSLTVANGSLSPGLFVGNTVEVISEYNPASSRSTALTSGNVVDIFVNGTTASLATEQVAFNPAYTMSSTTTTGFLNSGNYLLASGMVASGNATVAGDYYVPLNVQPVINFPSQLSISSSGVADTIYLYNNATNSGVTYPIALNPYGLISFFGTVSPSAAAAGTNFVSVNTTLTPLYPGLALGSGILTSGQPYFISSVTTSGIYLNKNVTSTITGGLNVAMSGRAIVYPIYDNTNNRNSVLQTTGLLFDSAAPLTGWPTLPNTLAFATYTHGYNNDVVTVESLVQQSRPLGVNTLVHQASFVGLNINVSIVFSSNASQTTTQQNIYNQINVYLNSLPFLASISFSSIASQFLNAAGVNNIRITSINTVATDGTVLNTFTKDFALASNQLPTLNAINYTIKGASNF